MCDQAIGGLKGGEPNLLGGSLPLLNNGCVFESNTAPKATGCITAMPAGHEPQWDIEPQPSPVSFGS